MKEVSCNCYSLLTLPYLFYPAVNVAASSYPSTHQYAPTALKLKRKRKTRVCTHTNECEGLKRVLTKPGPLLLLHMGSLTSPKTGWPTAPLPAAVLGASRIARANNCHECSSEWFGLEATLKIT